MPNNKKPVASKSMRRRQRDLLKAIGILFLLAVAIGTWPKKSTGAVETPHGHGKTR